LMGIELDGLIKKVYESRILNLRIFDRDFRNDFFLSQSIYFFQFLFGL
jgi:hypothetical protein